MRAKTFIGNDKAIVVFEDEHKNVFAKKEEVVENFASFNVALIWAEKEVFNGFLEHTYRVSDI